MARRKRYRRETGPEQPLDLDLRLEEIIADLDSGVPEWIVGRNEAGYGRAVEQG